MSNEDERREAKTDPVGTQPPESTESAPPMRAIPPAAPLPSTGPNPSFAEDTMRDLLATAKRLELHYSALLSPDGLLEGQTKTIAGLIDTNHKLVLHQFEVLSTSIKDLTRRADGADDRLDDGAEHFARLDGEVLAMRTEMTAMTARVTELENELKALRNAATPTPQTTG